MAISGVNFQGLNQQATATNSALQDLSNNTDPTKIPELAARLQLQSSALESHKKATEQAINALAGK